MKESPDYTPINHDDPRSSSEIEDDFLISKNHPTRQQRRRCMRPLLAIIAVLALAAYTAILVALTWRMTRQSRLHGTRFLKSPANDYITYEPYVMEQWELPGDIQYFGEPSKEVDQNWHNIFEHQNIGFSAELMHELGREEEGIRLPDGTYFGSLMVFHHLHCLKNIYHALNPSYYHLDKLQGSELAMHKEHTDHCMHMLMDAVMCQGDTTVLTMKWDAKGARPIGNLSSPHECVNWDRLMEWVVPNSVDVFADGMLVHPTFGAYIFAFRCMRHVDF
ncbi:hypothetical protein J3458_001119 [Metarhizium acridum]|uniref:uncharacterized protein n=1 Tax=Metarhizium acridum TaxID=92637 RepID=UPI001C6AAD08|nr:hypothetical protein J3458_001119 [Metarhizium acridum]